MEFLESIQLHNGTLGLLPLHQKRINATFEKFYPNKKPLNLSLLLSTIHLPTEGWYKVRISYDQKDSKVEILPYKIKKIQSLTAVFNNSIDYAYKSLYREPFSKLTATVDTDDIIIIKNGKVTDSSYANLIFWDGETWFTPRTYLLNGVCRQHLLLENKIKEREIEYNELSSFKKIGLINAMLGLGDVVLDISAIKLPPAPL